MNLFDYVASVLSYFIIAIPILAGKYDELSTADLASVISKVLIFCLPNPSSVQQCRQRRLVPRNGIA